MVTVVVLVGSKTLVVIDASNTSRGDSSGRGMTGNSGVSGEANSVAGVTAPTAASADKTLKLMLVSLFFLPRHLAQFRQDQCYLARQLH